MGFERCNKFRYCIKISCFSHSRFAIGPDSQKCYCYWHKRTRTKFTESQRNKKNRRKLEQY